jgi:hypothetical protein
MANVCGSDPLVCIEFVVWGLGEFLKDWTTLAMLAVLLTLLIKERADRQRRREAAYARELLASQERRALEAKGMTWVVEDGRMRES